ncbi:MAG: hypothetical protein CBE48_001095 [Flavobacteriales bacterium TMED288]|nr:MAG: hypothetical protein CBE48_001095 [Flavobacteriales bacterium TMED288]
MNKFDDVRDIFFNNFKKNFLRNKKYYILTNDADVFTLKSLRNHKRFIDAGVAEQNLINIASGIAGNNNYPLVYGFCSFLTFRCYEQLRFNVGSHKLNIKIVGIGPGYSFPYDGPTHHGLQDIYLIYLIPEFEIFNISDNNLANLISKNIHKIKGPTYIRIDKGKLNFNSKVKYNLDKGFEFTYKSKKREKLIITTGYICKLANETAEKFKNIDVINLFKLKNYDKKKFIRCVKKYKKIIIFDENSKSGGISPIVLNILNENKVSKNPIILSSKDEQSFFYSQNRELNINNSSISKKDLLKLIKLR